MDRLPDRFHLPSDPIAHDGSVVRGEHFRITVVTQRLIRLEWSASGEFEDRPTQTVLCRDLGPCEFLLAEDTGGVRIDTPYVHLRYDRGPFRPSGLSARVIGVRDHAATWHYGDVLPIGEGNSTNFGGTARTLDRVDGPTELEPGLLGRAGWAVVDDSRALALTEDGWVAPRRRDPSDVDLYLFAYADDAAACLTDFHRLTGAQPMLPRYAFGNWWSRYHRYTDDEYRELVARFEREDLPFSVAVIDTDWHLVDDVPPEYGEGWTGYTWNRKLFPDPTAFLAWLHEHGLRVTLNVHPSDGVRGFEEPYERLALALGTDPADDAPIDFDIASRRFTTAYLEQVHHPMEDDGVDFWWIDWQQGRRSRLDGLDPLWMLNHVHFLDSTRRGGRPLTFSRYAGMGSHRYPIGFSGDTVVSWASLDFQPYFTATAANAGYGWWSHDIGGHMFGAKDDELTTRWVQLGVFSPVLRLHSTNDPFNSKEPWRFGPEFERVMGDWLRFRHRLVPYLYTMNHRTHTDAVSIVRPVYHTHPQAEAHTNRNQFWFGSALLVAPITSPRSRVTGLGSACAWLPPGTWVDLFSGVVYDGDRTIDFHRSLDDYPVIAPAGAIVPLTADGDHDIANPDALELLVAAGADGAFTLYEDDDLDGCEDGSGASSARTTFEVDWTAGTFTVNPVEGDPDVVPDRRDYTVTFVGIADEAVETDVGSPHHDRSTARLSVHLTDVTARDGASFRFAAAPGLADNRIAERVFRLVDAAQVEFATKRRIHAITSSNRPAVQQLAALHVLGLDADLHGALVELVSARVVHRPRSSRPDPPDDHRR